MDAEAALARAAEIDAVRGLVLGTGRDRTARLSELSAHHPLLGLPTAFKDLVDVAGMPTTMGTTALPPRVPGRDDPLARRVHFAGAVSVGKTQVPEFGLPCYSETPWPPRLGTRWTQPGSRAAPPAVGPPQWRPECCRWPRAATAAVR
ncbi:amidase family protein [Nesterenkonia sp. PF2B19]|uniref:amidase family protein n=1 Tax=Nesterenkonia sp. PF2B19 TaxID=1881858 RepID=UPI001482B8C2|nr:amidase family protein [Nesterenkonia sp. PF2B19]